MIRVRRPRSGRRPPGRGPPGRRVRLRLRLRSVCRVDVGQVPVPGLLGDSDGEQREQHRGDDVQGDGGRGVVVRQQGGGDQRCRGARRDGGELGAHGGAGVAHPGAEHLGEEGGLGRVHRAVQHQADGDGEDQVAEARGVDEPEEREHPQPDAGRTEQVHRTPADAVRERAPGRDDREVHGGGDEDGVQGGLLGHVRGRGRVDQDEGGDDVVGDVLGHPRAHRDEHVPPVVAQHGHERQLLGGVRAAGSPAGLGGGEGLPEDGRLVDGQADPQPDHDQHPGQQERHAPAPAGEHVVREHRGQQGQHAGREQLPRGRAGLRPGGPEAASACVAVLGHQQHRAAPLAAEREALHQPQQGQQHRGRGADTGVGRQQPDREGRPAHQQQAQHQQLLAAEPVPVVPEDQRPQRPGREAHGIGQERQQGPDQRVGAGKNSLLNTRAAAEP